jgi:hypothetical protein
MKNKNLKFKKITSGYYTTNKFEISKTEKGEWTLLIINEVGCGDTFSTKWECMQMAKSYIERGIIK